MQLWLDGFLWNFVLGQLWKFVTEVQIWLKWGRNVQNGTWRPKYGILQVQNWTSSTVNCASLSSDCCHRAVWIKWLHWFPILLPLGSCCLFHTYIHVVKWNECVYSQLVVMPMIYYHSLEFEVQRGDCCDCTLYSGNFMHFTVHSIRHCCDQFDGFECHKVHFILWKWNVYKNVSIISVWVAEFASHLQSN